MPERHAPPFLTTACAPASGEMLRQSTRGVATLGIIFGFLLFGSLTLAVLIMSSSSQLEVVSSNLSQRAYYLAESGFRIAAGYYLNTSDTGNNNLIDDDKSDVLKDYLHSRTFTVGTQGRVTLTVYPYWLNSIDGTGTSRSARLPGTTLPGFTIPSVGQLFFVDNTNPTNEVSFNYTGGSLVNGIFSYTVAGSVPTVPATKESIYFFLNPSISTSMQHNGSLSLTLPSGYTAQLFPQYRGLIQVRRASLDPALYTYEKARLQGTNLLVLNGLRKISDPENTTSWSEAVDQTTQIIFKKFIILESHGRTGDEERMLRFYTPIQDSLPTPLDVTTVPTTKNEWLNTFGVSPTIDEWDVRELTSSGGGRDVYAEIQDLDTTTGGSGNSFKHGTFWYKDRNKINTYWSLGGHRLSYDVQAKPGTGKSLANLAVGISVRARGSTLNDPDNYLGVSFMRYSLPTVYFRNGSQTIAPGTQITGESSGATGRLQGDPILTSGSIGDGTARGWLRLASASRSFSNNEYLLVGGHRVARLLSSAGYVAALANDYIPDAIKPRPSNFSPARYDIGALLLVLWERNGNTWRWLAYKDITNDEYVRGFQDWNEPEGSYTGNNPPEADGQVINDKACLLLRVREKREMISSSMLKYNLINVYWGDASERWTTGRPGNSLSYDIMTGRKRYLAGSNPLATYFPAWPPQRTTFWTQGIDFFSHVEQPSPSGTPLPEFQWDAVNPNVSSSLLDFLDDGTLRTASLPTYEYPAHTSYTQHEVGLHAFGDIRIDNSPFYFGSVAFADFALRFVFENAQLYGGFLEPAVL